jgi:hypothetical protein
MNPSKCKTLTFALVAAMTMVCGVHPARALEGFTTVTPIQQLDFTSSVKVGHLVTARSYMTQVTAGGSFRVTCPSPATGAIEAQQSLSQSVIRVPNVLTVNIPPGFLPAYRQLPGFDALPGGTTLTCAYYWIANARESGVNLGGPGGGFPIGNETYSAGDTVTFEMYKPGGGGDEDNNGCIR